MARPQTSIPDEIYDIVSVLYHALQGAETYEQYIRDAEQRGDRELAQYFREVQEEEIGRALKGKELLARRLAQ
jgi:rubrerythrin